MMNKKLLTIGFFLLAGTQIVKSQQAALRNPKLGIGLEALAGDSKWGTGYFLNFQSPIFQNLNWTVTLGKTNLQSTLKVMPKPKYENFVTKVGAKYFLNDLLYISGDVGAAFDQIQRKTTRFAWSPGFGGEINVFEGSTIDIGGRYEVYQSGNPLRFFALRAALNLGL